MKAIKIIFLTIILLTSNLLFGQVINKTIDLTKLTGKWECVKVTRTIKNKTEDISKDYKPNYITYLINSKFADEYPASNTTINGNYKVDKKTMVISYNGMTQTTKYPNSKVPMNDLVQDGFKEGPLKIIKLTETELTVFYKKSELSEGPGDDTFYFKKIK
jgi:hypothetical protein